MDITLFHEARGVWLASAVPSEDETQEQANARVVATYAPEGTVIIPNAPDLHSVWNPASGEWEPGSPTPRYANAAEAKAALAEHVSNYLAGMNGAIPADEKLSWAAKEAAARAIIAGAANEKQTSLVQVEADITGESVADLSVSIVAKADAYWSVMARITGLRRKAESDIDTAENATAYQPIVDGFALALAI